MIQDPGTLLKSARGKSLAAACALALLAGCAAAPPGEVGEAYRAALADAALAEPLKALPLLALPEGPAVRVISWVRPEGRPCDAPGCSFRVDAQRMWVTVDGELAAKCRAWGLEGDALRERLEQLLGLPPRTPPQWRKTHLVTLAVPRTALQRPCLGESRDASGAPRCTLRPATPAPDPELHGFVLEQMARAWVADPNDAPGYPFTRLGYTYDWHPSAAGAQHYGASEFVVRPGTEGVMVAATATDDYCR